MVAAQNFRVACKPSDRPPSIHPKTSVLVAFIERAGFVQSEY